VRGHAPRRLALLLGLRLRDESRVAGDEARDGHLTVCLGEVAEERKHARIDAACLDVVARTRRERDALVAEHLGRELRSRRATAAWIEPTPTAAV
jgi:hypothetical protein